MEEGESKSQRRLSLRSSPEGDELLIHAGRNADPDADEDAAASESPSETLTLLDELSKRRARAGKLNLAINFVCAIASLTFAFLAYQKL